MNPSPPPGPIAIWMVPDRAGRGLLEAALAGAAFRLCHPYRPSPGDLAALAGAEVAFGNPAPALFASCRHLRWLQLESIGFEEYSPANVPPGLVITNLKGMFEWPAAETALAGILGLARGLRRLVPAQPERRWIEMEVRPETWLLHGRRALVLGAGSIGRRVRRLLQAFECEVLSFARTHPEAELRTAAALAAAAPRCDLLICCLPLTPDTAGLISRSLLEALPPHALVVNIGRGAVMDEGALDALLRAGRLGGAVVDVTAAEPLPPQHPFWSCPNLLLTQHTGGGYAEEILDKVRLFLENLALYRAGQPLRNVIDLRKSY